MAAERYVYTGGAGMYYQDYRDLDTGKMLVAEAGGSYAMQSIDLNRPVPPNDGRWEGAPPPPPPPVRPPVIQPPQPVVAAPAPAPDPEGGVS